MVALLFGLLLVSCMSWGQEAADALDDAMQIDDMTFMAVKAFIALVFAWIGKRVVGKAWLQAMLNGLEVGVNSAWEGYVKPKKQAGNGKLEEGDKAGARAYAIDRGKAAMGIGAQLLMAVTPKAKLAALVSGIVNRRKREARQAK
jgi:hypothetical protein